MAKRLMFIISTSGKTSEEISKKALEAYQKFQKVSKKVQEAKERTAGTPKEEESEVVFVSQAHAKGASRADEKEKRTA